jgi:hypothetical protein
MILGLAYYEPSTSDFFYLSPPAPIKLLGFKDLGFTYVLWMNYNLQIARKKGLDLYMYIVYSGLWKAPIFFKMTASNSLQKEGNKRDTPPPSQWGAQPRTQPKRLTHKAPLKTMRTPLNKVTLSISRQLVHAPSFINVFQVFIFLVGTCFMHFAHAVLL